jgi:hypothetical protein
MRVLEEQTIERAYGKGLRQKAKISWDPPDPSFK